MINVIVDAKFPQAKPAHHAFIQKRGFGSNLDRAVRDAVHNIMTDERLRGKRADTVLPATFTVQIEKPLESEDD